MKILTVIGARPKAAVLSRYIKDNPYLERIPTVNYEENMGCV